MPDNTKDIVKAVVDATTSTPKKRAGFRSTEFWLAAAATIVGLLMASGALETGSMWEKVVGLAVAALASMGYSAARGRVKASGD